MITICDRWEGWAMTVNLEWIMQMIESGAVRREGYSIIKMRKIYALTVRYADDNTYEEIRELGIRYPAALEALERRRM